MRRVITLVLVLSLVVVVRAQVAPHPFGLDDFSRVVRVTDPQFAPDGRSIAVVESKPNLDADRYDPALVLVDVAKGTSKTLVNGQVGLSSPRWSPDGRRIAFLAAAQTAGTPRSQVFVASVDNGRARAVTTTTMGVQQFAWSPDGRTIAFATADEPEKKSGPDRFNDSFEIAINDSLLTTAPPTSTHIWLVASDGSGGARRLTSGTWSLPVSRPPGPPASAIAWTADGTSIVFTRQQTPHGSGGNEVEIVNVADGTLKPFSGLRGTFPLLSPSGKSIALMTQGNVAVADVPGGTAKPITTAIDRNLASALWMPDGQALLVGGNDSTRVSMWIQPIDGAAKKIEVGDLSPNSSYHVDVAVARDGALAFTATSPMRPSELYYMASTNGPVKRLTDVNTETTALPLGRTEVVEWKNDTFTENGILTYPPDFSPSRKYPLVLLIHGGPRAASMLTFSAPAQLMAARGWLVFQPNYRGSDNLGNAYQRAISGDAGEGPGRDVMAGIEAVKQKDIVDDTRMAVSGWSYGGYMTAWMIGHYDVWKAAVAGAAVTDQLDQSTLGDGTNARGANSPWIDPQAFERARAQSPITSAAKMKAPTLILHNIGDYRVTITQSYKLFHALRDAQFIAYPIAGHNAADPVRQRDVQRRWLEWLERYLNPVSTTQADSGAPR
jgi:dipeptidyl aminopeptidase/acylaminoacyl peptidase